MEKYVIFDSRGARVGTVKANNSEEALARYLGEKTINVHQALFWKVVRHEILEAFKKNVSLA